MDSGPVILGVGFAATIVIIGIMSMYDHAKSANQQYKTIHAFVFLIEDDQNKKYLFDELPMADAFIAWCRATDLLYSPSQPNSSTNNWRHIFHQIFLLILLILWMPIYFGSARRYVNTEFN